MSKNAKWSNAGLDDFPPYVRIPYEETGKRIVAELTRAITTAVEGWATQAGITVERWCELYEPHIEAIRHETPSTTMTFRVTAELKGTPHVVFPYRGEVVVGMSGPSQEPVTATTPEQVRELFGYPVPLCTDGRPVHDFRGQATCPACGYAPRFMALIGARYEPTEETDEP
jgi:hypothetical protein